MGGDDLHTVGDDIQERIIEGWTPTIHIHALSMKILIVARTRIEGTWSAYCDAVPGWDHYKEYDEVLSHGDKLDEKIARVLFPVFDEMPYDS